MLVDEAVLDQRTQVAEVPVLAPGEGGGEEDADRQFGWVAQLAGRERDVAARAYGEEGAAFPHRGHLLDGVGGEGAEPFPIQLQVQEGPASIAQLLEYPRIRWG